MMFGTEVFHESGWIYVHGLGYRLLGSDKLFAFGRWYKNGKDGELNDWHLRFWDWSQTGPDSCYGLGKWMPVIDDSVVKSFPAEWAELERQNKYPTPSYISAAEF